jgi:Holliday junction resolvase
MQYKEAAPHLILQGFLQRVINGGGYIIRDMAAGTGRLDLGVVYRGVTYPIEIKLWKGESYYRKGLEQAARYIDILGCKEGWVVVFDQRTGKTWDEKIYKKQETLNDIVIHIYGI